MKFPLIYLILFSKIITRIRAGHFYSSLRDGGVLSLLSPPLSLLFNYQPSSSTIKRPCNSKDSYNFNPKRLKSKIQRVEVFKNTSQDITYLVCVLYESFYTHILRIFQQENTARYITHYRLYI